MRRKVLVQINSHLNIGSTGHIAEEIGLLAEKNGWDCYIVHAGRHTGKSQLKSIPASTSIEEKYHAVMTRIFDWHGLVCAGATRRLVGKIKSLNPDLIHIHNIHGYFINYKILFDYLKSADIPVIWTLHDCWSITGHCAYFDMVNCFKWKISCNNCPAKGQYPSSIFCDNSKNNFLIKKNLFSSINNLTLVPVSFWLEGIIRESYFKDVKNLAIRTIQNGVNLKIFKPIYDLGYISSLKEKYNIKSKYIIIGIAAIWAERKGFSDYLKLRELLDENYTILLVGLKQNQIKKLPEGIIGLPRTSSISELCDLYNVSDVLVNLTYEDNFPTVNIEALACGVPIVTYDTGGCPEVIDEYVGRVVKKKDFKNLVSAIDEMVSLNRTLELRQACRSKAEQLYNKDDRYMDYLNLYNEKCNK